jgi:transposase-like protein
MKCLSLTGRQVLTVKKIWKILSDAGVKILSDTPESALGWALRKRERKFGDVILVGNGEWGLTEWYSADEVERMRASRNNASGRNREEHSERTKAGMNLAWSERGVRIGAKRKMTPEKMEQAKELLSQGMTIKEVAKALDVATSSITGNGLRARALRKEKSKDDERATQLRLVK